MCEVVEKQHPLYIVDSEQEITDWIMKFQNIILRYCYLNKDKISLNIGDIMSIYPVISRVVLQGQCGEILLLPTHYRVKVALYYVMSGYNALLGEK